MELLLARNELNEKPKKVQLDKIKDELKKEAQKIFYFDRDNSHKDMMALVEALEKEGFNIYFREIKYGLADDEYMYEVHAL
ncbi:MULTISPECIES: HP0268 family nuclease [Arcobacteraceae]|uniref:HP0268 domain-containing protein n=1 Tax=Aliarcobacter skirrowii TaxID=28200 RepID=A0A2U2C1Q1_9BACT|nr:MULTISPECIES: HP0268 family nuclease [Arcobacteraceae]MDD2508297.1 HP0268 family nuclease [Aliarcobacter skirrowii]MDD3025148.1 HP0268 family nuclease [Aliarcobacter skirrowii]MDD3496637.1 HP0268 family nuclease [Aliarcobacter skirrowii]MDX3959591.1 HP0268 family nuclease [Aliarcobacter skirrowii]MDX4012084.1 HP0268 family nuclease [Aliarcobacter skirrowii]